jgi:outer membrane protein assembly factor BamA
MRFRFLALAVLFSSWTALSFAQCGTPTPKYFVANVNLENPGHLSAEQQAMVKLKLVGRCFDDFSVSELLSPVQTLYQSFGYFQAAVHEPHRIRVLDETRHPAPVSLTFDVEEGPQFLLDVVEWWGVEAPSIQQQIWELTALKPGDVFDRSKVQEILAGVRRLYISSGYPNAIIASEVTVHPPRRVSLRFTVQEGAAPEVLR